MNKYLTKGGKYAGKALDRFYEPVCRKINNVVEAKTALVVGTGLELCGIGQILHSAAVNHNPLEIVLGSIFIVGGSFFLGASLYKHLPCSESL